MLVGRNIDRMRRHIARNCDLENTDAQNISVEIDYYEEKDYTEVDNRRFLLVFRYYKRKSEPFACYD